MTVDKLPERSIFEDGPEPKAMTPKQAARKAARDHKWRKVRGLRDAMTDAERHDEARRIRAEIQAWEHNRRRFKFLTERRDAA